MDSARPAQVDAPPATQSGSDYPGLEVGLFAFICFLPSLAAGFVYDDILLIRDNRYAHGLAFLGRAFTHYFWQITDRADGTLLYYRPLVTATYLVDWAVSGGKPWFFHLFNVAVHAAATYLVVVLVRRWTGRTSLAVAVALLFALHPSRTESVIWIAGRTDVLMTFFMLLCVEVSYRAARSSTGRARVIAASSLSFVLALLCKEAAALLPLLLLADMVLAADKNERAKFLPGFSIHAILAGIYVLLRVFVFPVRPLGKLTATPEYGFMTVFAYAERVVWPLPQTFFYRPLVADHGNFVFPLPLVVGGVVIAVAYTTVVVVAFRRDRLAALLFVTAAAAFGPLLNFTYTGIFVTTSDHFLYLPLFLFLSAVARLWREPLTRWADTRAGMVGFSALLVFYGAVTTLRTFDYGDQEAIYVHELHINPDNPLVLKALSEDRARDGRIDEAFELLLLASRPESRKYSLLVPDWLDYQDYFRLLDLQVARTADGDVRDLAAIYDEFNAILAGRPAPATGHVGQLAIGRRVGAAQQEHALKNGARELLAAETALLASRLGHDARARALLATVNAEGDLDVLPNAQNVSLTYARLGDFASAYRWLGVLTEQLPFRYSEEAILPERKRFARAEALFRRSVDAPPGEHHRLRAEAELELGAYLRGLKELKPVFDADPDAPGVGPLYVQLLVAAGLEGEARAVASRALGADRGTDLVRDIFDRLPARVQKLRKPTEPSDWYAPKANP